MNKANCEITLIRDSSRKLKIQLFNDQTWKIIESPNGGLKIVADKGTWISPFDWSKIVTCLSKNSLVLVIYKISDTFWNDLSFGKTVESNDASLFNDNANEEKVNCKFSNGD
jgi:hypothetical protein